MHIEAVHCKCLWPSVRQYSSYYHPTVPHNCPRSCYWLGFCLAKLYVFVHIYMCEEILVSDLSERQICQSVRFVRATWGFISRVYLLCTSPPCLVLEVLYCASWCMSLPCHVFPHSLLFGGRTIPDGNIEMRWEGTMKRGLRHRQEWRLWVSLAGWLGFYARVHVCMYVCPCVYVCVCMCVHLSHLSYSLSTSPYM